jgi:dihydroxyacetone kinase DhaKLM complex PTS-EIIA-like component DhaM
MTTDVGSAMAAAEACRKVLRFTDLSSRDALCGVALVGGALLSSYSIDAAA